MTTSGKKNIHVNQALDRFVERVDAFLGGATVDLPAAENRRACELLLEKQKASVIAASTFFAFYSLVNPIWDMSNPPTGFRGGHGDKRFKAELDARNLTLGNVVAFGENIGTKGNVSSGNLKLTDDQRFKDFLPKLLAADMTQRQKMADFLAMKFAESRRVTNPLPPVGEDVLTFARAKALFHTILATPSEGFIQQFMVYRLLKEHRKRYGFTVKTQHPHAADRSSRTAGDIEEHHRDTLIRAYEVTVRDDWKNRISSFKAKMDEYGLQKYVIIASDINGDPDWGEPANLITNVEKHGRDLAVIDILDFVHVFIAELTSDELRDVVNGIYEDLCNPKLGNKEPYKVAYKEVVEQWLDAIPEGHDPGQSEAN